MTKYSREVMDESEIKPVDVYRNAIRSYGKEAQCRQAMEECAELIQAVNKCLRAGTEDNIIHMFDEVADVVIMIEQLCVMYGWDYENIRKARVRKLVRLAKRLGMI